MVSTDKRMVSPFPSPSPRGGAWEVVVESDGSPSLGPSPGGGRQEQEGLVMVVAGEFVPEGVGERALAVVGEVAEPTVEEILEVFGVWMRLDVAEGNGSPQTLRAYAGDVRQHLEWLWELGLRPAQAGEEELKGYRSYLVERYAVSTVGRKLAAVRRFYGMAMARGVMGHNPAAGLKAPRDKTAREERVKYLPLESVRAVLAAPNVNRPKGIRDRAMLVLMAMHGLRVIEVHRLDLEDVDLEGGEAGTLRVLGKGDKYRTILLTEETREVVKVWLAARALMRSGSPAVFLTMHWSNEREPGRVSTRGMRQVVDGYLEMVGAKKAGISCHSLRHSFATLALAAGGSLLAISGALGHSSVTTTQVYTKIVDKARHNPAKLLVGLL